MSREWIELDPCDLDEPREAVLDGVPVILMASPNDVPEGIRGYFDERLKRFVIEFRYSSDESWRRVPDPARHVTFRLGRNSRRLYALEVDLNAAKERWVSLVVQAIEEQKKELRNIWRRNYDIASNLVQERAPQLLAAA